ncbi:MAG: hypothetical protein NC218_00780 [Acetobacter sp.]|nr:hypothetical protein [Acetobacter sp.]
MKKVFFSLIFSCLLVNFVEAAENLTKYESECLSFVKPPKIELSSTYGKLKYNFEKDGKFLRQETVKRLQKLQIENSTNFEPVGLTKVRDAFDFALTVGQIDVSNGYTCLYPETITIHLGYYVPTIYILNSLRKDSCLYNIALRHEKTHMQIYIEALDYFLPRLKEYAGSLFEQLGVKIVKKAQVRRETAQELNDLYLDAVRTKVDAWRKDVETEQLKLDTPEHYIIENKLCQEIERQDDMF